MKRFPLLLFLLALMLVVSSIGIAQGRGAMPDGVATHIIVFNDSVGPNQLPAAVPDFAAAHDLHVTHEYNSIRGVAAVVPAGRLRALQNDPRVAYVEENMEIQIFAQTVPTGIDRAYAASNTAIDIDAQDDYRVDVDVAVIDTGVYAHADLNLVQHVDCVGGTCSNGGSDGNGHGTHVAGTIGAIDNGSGVVGVAPGARIHGVRVLDDNGSGYTSWVIAGIDWVAANASTIEVANMSLGGAGSSSAQDAAISAAINNGVVFVVAAGNDADNASGYSPASHPDVVTVSALADFDGSAGGYGSATCRSDQDDTFASFSNYGSVVEMIAPGVCILSTWNDGSYNTISGTSMATPHVAGAVALLTSGSNSPSNSADVQAVINTLLSAGNYNWNNSDDPDGIKEPLLDVSTFVPTLVATGTGGGGGGGGSTTDMYVYDLSTSTSRWGWRYWYVTTTATIADGDGYAVSGATVSLTASGAINGSGTCTTDSSGSCSLSTGWMYGGSSVTFTVTDVTASGFTYDAGLNNETSITAYR